ncbi:hypothetical protein [Verrucomicrobium spinosum]|uniref:hypothetical protein n=1 Tax=Verrucomicrobium spinosum TaxID=2736 RepID=UPI0012E2E2FF|nr:hypothetical protein [Verrucomicrobium spinosum]
MAELLEQLELRTEESKRRAAERDKAKQMVVELNERLKKTKINAAKPSRKLGDRLKRLFSASS